MCGCSFIKEHARDRAKKDDENGEENQENSQLAGRQLLRLFFPLLLLTQFIGKRVGKVVLVFLTGSEILPVNHPADKDTCKTGDNRIEQEPANVDAHGRRDGNWARCRDNHGMCRN